MSAALDATKWAGSAQGHELRGQGLKGQGSGMSFRNRCDRGELTLK